MNGKKGMQEGNKSADWNLEVKPGEVKQGWLAVEGCCYELPMTVICGGTGKVTLITGGVHNAEYVGIQAAVELAQELKPGRNSRNFGDYSHRQCQWIYPQNHEPCP